MIGNITALVADDEQPARKKIVSFLNEEKGLIARIFEAENGVKAVQILEEQTIDVVFLDIQMPGMTGFEVIDTIGVENMPAVVFVTAFDQYAINAFEVQAIDYLLKPFDQARFQQSFHKALNQVQRKNDSSTKLIQLIADIRKEKPYMQRIVVHEGVRYLFVQVKDIHYISAEEKYVQLHTEKESYLKRDTMNRLEQLLDPSKFARIHRSTIINMDFIKELQSWSHGDYIAILKNGKELTVSRRYRDRLFGKK
jgi:two-component system LytT family response regulator